MNRVVPVAVLAVCACAIARASALSGDATGSLIVDLGSFVHAIRTYGWSVRTTVASHVDRPFRDMTDP
jgi:hypothetical protein